LDAEIDKKENKDPKKSRESLGIYFGFWALDIGRIKVITGIRFGIPTVRSPQQIQLRVE
jgi:hypothetical protein